MTGLGLETSLVAPLALIALFVFHIQGSGSLGRVDVTTHLWLAATGVVTATPLLLFATGARLIPLSTVGILQFIAPSVSFLLGVFLYREPFGPIRFASFVLIWLGLVIAVWEFARQNKRLPSRAMKIQPG